MPPLIRYNFAPTLNGVIASAPSFLTPWIVSDPTIDFPALYAEFSVFLLGRRTYETFLAMGSNENPLAGRPRESVVVFTRDSDKAIEWSRDVTVVSDDAVGFVRALKAKPLEGDIWLMGGGELAGLLLRAGLVDIVEAAIMPAVVGKGVSMFGEGVGEGDKGEQGWQLVLEKAEALKTGILMTRYRVLY
ncbi:dihydrofolate reductase-like domain-containing protein [Corynascus similis CBS 632.67]